MNNLIKVCVFSLVLFTHGFALQPRQAGSCSYGEETIDSLEVVGIVKLNKTKILNLLKVTGTVIADTAQLSQAEIIGDCSLTNTSVHEKMQITGPIRAANSKFDSSLTLIGQSAVFSHCHLSNIFIQREFGFKAAQQIELKAGTIVDGAITFEGGNGEVFLYPNSKIRGAVSGGKIFHKP